jgi:integrase
LAIAPNATSPRTSRAGRTPSTAHQWERTLATYAAPVIGDLPVQAIDTALVLQVVEPLWNMSRRPRALLRGRIEAILDWAAARGYRKGDNPARWKGHLENLLPKKTKVHRTEHHPALPYAKVFMAVLRKQDGIAARALEFAILTASRTTEVRGAKWEEFDLAGRLWTVPAGRMKRGREHRVPLSDRALAIVEEMAAIRSCDFVFPGQKTGRPIGQMALAQVLGRLNGGITVHGFRSCFSHWCTECTNFPAEAREMALAHAVGSKVEAAYRRGDLFEKRRALMAACASYITSSAPAR